MIINLQVIDTGAGYFSGESLELCINSNNKEIASTPIEFLGSTREGVIAQVRMYARGKFGAGNGVIRLIK